jgi:hypothetical protein
MKFEVLMLVKISMLVFYVVTQLDFRAEDGGICFSES